MESDGKSGKTGEGQWGNFKSTTLQKSKSIENNENLGLHFYSY